MSKKAYSIVTLAVLAVILLTQSLFTVYQTQMALILQLGKPVGEALGPGLHFKLPFVQNVLYFDSRIINYDATSVEALTRDKKVIILDNYFKWRIEDPLLFHQKLQSMQSAQATLRQIVQSEQLAVVASYDLTDIVSGLQEVPEASDLMGRLASYDLTPLIASEQPEIVPDGSTAASRRLVSTRQVIMAKVIQQANAKIKAQGLGARVVDVRIKRTDLPPENQRAIVNRMTAERQRQAMEYRSEGNKEATIITSTVDRDKAIILAKAHERSEIIRGQGEAEAIRIFGRAISQSPEFYTFTRSLEAYKKALSDNTRIVLNPEDPFLKFLRGLQ